MTIKPKYFSKSLINWYLENKRDLPWRKTSDPYTIWLSEVILQQTRIDQGLPYFLKFIEAFPTVQQLANASESEVLKLWQGLGYYSRARNLHSTAKYISTNKKGVFPKTYNELIQLKGVGDYTASAIASICFNLPTAVVDGNVYRVLSRIFDIDIPINSSEGKKTFKALAQDLIDSKKPGTFNQALMEFGARHCTPQKPNCFSCVFNNHCTAFRNSKVSELPVKLKKNKIKKRYFNFVVFVSEDNKTILKQRVNKGIWQQLYEFPLVETLSEITHLDLINNVDFIELFSETKLKHINKYNEKPIIHKLSHQHLYTTFWIAETEALNDKGISKKKINNYPVPVLIENFIEEFGF